MTRCAFARPPHYHLTRAAVLPAHCTRRTPTTPSSCRGHCSAACLGAQAGPSLPSTCGAPTSSPSHRPSHPTPARPPRLPPLRCSPWVAGAAPGAASASASEGRRSGARLSPLPSLPRRRGRRRCCPMYRPASRAARRYRWRSGRRYRCWAGSGAASRRCWRQCRCAQMGVCAVRGRGGLGGRLGRGIGGGALRLLPFTPTSPLTFFPTRSIPLHAPPPPPASLSTPLPPTALPIHPLPFRCLTTHLFPVQPPPLHPVPMRRPTPLTLPWSHDRRLQHCTRGCWPMQANPRA